MCVCARVPAAVARAPYEAASLRPLTNLLWFLLDVCVRRSGFLGELWFAGPNGKYWVFTTQVSIIPNTFPFPDCSGAGCLGGLV